MPRFNAAKSWKKLDDDLSGKFNYLCDLLDEGYSSVALINNHEIAIDINPKDGIKIVNDGSSIFSLDPLTGEIVIGKYDDLISDLGTDLGTAYNDIAQQLGYTDYDDMVAEAIAGNTIITGGWIRTSLIQANTILFNQLASVAVTSITDTIDLGGRNLLKDSDKDVTNNNYNLTAYTWSNVSDMVPGEKYTITIEGTLPAGLSWYINVYTQDPTGYPMLATLSDSDKVSANKWVKTVTMPTLASGQTFTGRTNLYQFPLGSGQSVSVTRIKIERGNKATDWTPAPEDKLSEGVSYAGVEIDATNGFVSTATISGKTAIIKANAIDGLAFYDSTTYRGGLQVVDGQLVLAVDVLKDPDNNYGYVLFSDSSGTYSSFLLDFYTGNSSTPTGSVNVAYINAYHQKAGEGGATNNWNNIILSSWCKTGERSFTAVSATDDSSYSHASLFLYAGDVITPRVELTAIDYYSASSSLYLGSDLLRGTCLEQKNISTGAFCKLGVLYNTGPWVTFNDSTYYTVWTENQVNFAVGSGTSNATGGADTNVSFGKTFATAPKVCANSINESYTCRIKSVSTTGFVLVISGGSVTFNYIAVSV